MKWGEARWRRLYVREEGSFALLPLYVRALAGELLKFTDDDGRIFVGEREPWEVIARLAGAETGERRTLRLHIPILLKDGYLVRDGAYIIVKNFGPAQGRDRRSNGARTMNEPSASDERTENEPCTNGERVVSEPCTNTDVSHRNDSEQGLVRAGASDRSDQNREDKIREEIPPTPLAGGLPVAGDATGQGGLFALDDGTGASGAAKRARRAPGAPPSHVRYANAYAAGIVDAVGGVYAPPTDTYAKSVFGKALPVHAIDADRQPLRGAVLEAWIRASAAEYRQARAGSAAFEGGFKPARWLDWLQGGKATALARASPRKAHRVQSGELDLEKMAEIGAQRAKESDEYLATGAAF